jgi:hypothetical protein
MVGQFFFNHVAKNMLITFNIAKENFDVRSNRPNLDSIKKAYFI